MNENLHFYHLQRWCFSVAEGRGNGVGGDDTQHQWIILVQCWSQEISLWIKLSTSISISRLIAAYKSQQLINRLQKAQRLHIARQTERESEIERHRASERQRKKWKGIRDWHHFFPANSVCLCKLELLIGITTGIRSGPAKSDIGVRGFLTAEL